MLLIRLLFIVRIPWTGAFPRDAFTQLSSLTGRLQWTDHGFTLSLTDCTTVLTSSAYVKVKDDVHANKEWKKARYWSLWDPAKLWRRTDKNRVTCSKTMRKSQQLTKIPTTTLYSKRIRGAQSSFFRIIQSGVWDHPVIDFCTGLSVRQEIYDSRPARQIVMSVF